MPLIKKRNEDETKKPQPVHGIALTTKERRALDAYCLYVGEPIGYVVPQMIERIIAADKGFKGEVRKAAEAAVDQARQSTETTGTKPVAVPDRKTGT